MLRHLVNHALQNVWCSPRQDNLHILQLHRVTAKYGALGVVRLMGREISLPNTSKRFHVFQIGQLSPAYLGLLAIKPNWIPERWTTFAAAINANSVQVDIYSETGIMFPRFRSYYMLTSDRNLIVAIEIMQKIPVDLDTTVPFIRFYKNAILSTVAGSATGEHLFHQGQVLTSSTDIVNITNKVNSYKAKDGYVSCWVNGVSVDKLDSFNMKINDIVEFVYDSTVYKVVTLNATAHPVFMSELDSMLKYIIHYAKDDENIIHFHDDVDVEIAYISAPGRFKGRLYNKNVYSSMRMLTHRDYSIPVDNVIRLIQDIQAKDRFAPRSIADFKIIFKIKEANRNRPLIYDSSRIFELYKLTDAKILRAMEGLDSTVDEWKAVNLEQSPYIRLMDLPYDKITFKQVQEAYGYNGVVSVLANNPEKTFVNSGRVQANIPMGYRINSTGYEYDADGLYLANSYIDENDDYYAVNGNAKKVEFIVGKALTHNDDIFGTDYIDLPRFDYRVYMAYNNDGVIDHSSWKDVTGTNHYTVENGQLKWQYLEVGHILCIRNDNSFYARDFNVKEEFGLLRIRLTELRNEQETDIRILRGDVDVFLNGRTLIPGLDYEIKLPYLYINNTKYLNRPVIGSVQKVHVRMTGFCNKDLTVNDLDEVGFIRHGLISDDSRFNLRDDRVLKITVDGKYVDKSSVEFAEDSRAVSVMDPRNGLPYQLRDRVIPVRDLIDDNSYDFKEKSLVIDKKVSDYLTEFTEPVDRGIVSAIGEKYIVSSPFLSRVLYRLSSNQISDNAISEGIGDMWILDQLQPDLHLLEADPITEENALPAENVTVAPHRYNNPITLSILKYRFLNRVVQLYCKTQLELSQFILINREL